ncbi:MAG: hypothetical protein MJ200_00915 [Mycoplasmoidaceae bacterium]|nr:hypothetical protein [Mycoplasmoidaceae bacterium]
MNKKYLMPITLVCGLTTAIAPIITACNKNDEGGGGKPVVDYVVDLGQLFKGFERKTPIIPAEEEVTFAIEEATTDYLTYVKNEPDILIEDIYFAISDQTGVKDQPASGQLGIDISNVDPETEIIISQGGETMHLPYKRIDAAIVADNLDFKVNSDGKIIHYQIDGYVIFNNL